MSYVRFLSVVAAIWFAGYAGLLLLGTSDSYCAHTKNFDVSACYKFDVHGQNADILLVGDSSLLYGIKPEIVTAVAHRSTYNYGIIGEVFGFAPTAVIDRYIEMNRTPTAIIAYIGAWDLIEPGKNTDPRYIPLAAAALQHPDVISPIAVLAARPFAIVEMPQIIGTGFSLREPNQIAWRNEMDAELGFVDYANQLPPEDRHLECSPEGKNARVPDAGASRAALDGLKRRYAKVGIKFYVYVAPFARCHVPVRAVEAKYRGIADNDVSALDNSLFVEEHSSGGHVHVNSAGSSVVSKMLGEFILSHRVASAR